MFAYIIRFTTSLTKITIQFKTGYGYLAPACRIYRGIEELKKMLTELVTRIIETFFNIKEDESKYYPNHVKSVGNILEQLPKGDIPEDLVIDIQFILVQLIKEFPNLPVQYQGQAKEAFLETSRHLDFNDVIYRGLIQTCSHAVVAESEPLEKSVICTKSYLTFWKAIAKEPSIFDAVLKCLIIMIEKLNFVTDTFEVVLNEHRQIIESQLTQESSLTQVLNEEAYKSETAVMVSTVKRPKMAKDHTILANLVVVICELDGCMTQSWQRQLLKCLMTKSTEYPEVSGFYKLITKIFAGNTVENSIFSNEIILTTTVNYLIDVAKKCQLFEHELLKSVLIMFLNTPKELLNSVLQFLASPISKVFSCSHSLNLTEAGIKNLVIF